MLKKIFLTSSLSLLLYAAAPMAACAQEASANADSAVVVKELPEGQVAVESDAVPSEEVNYIEESSTARKMTKEEKAQNVLENDSWGGAITIIAMLIVISALVVLSLLFLGFGKISEIILSKKKLKAHGKSTDDIEAHNEHVDEGQTIAAIAMALADHFNSNHDMEEYILTIRRMRRAYSPWNSKIYNLRHMPELSKNPERPLPGTKTIK